MTARQTRTDRAERRSPRCLWLLVGLLGLAPLAGARAAEADAAADAPAVEAPSAQPDVGSGSEGKDETSQDQDKPSADVFIPTEEISEDFAVSFPVDI